MYLTDWDSNDDKLYDVIFRIFDGYINDNKLHNAMQNDNITIDKDNFSVAFGDKKGYGDNAELLRLNSTSSYETGEPADVYCLGLLLATALKMNCKTLEQCLKDLANNGSSCVELLKSNPTDLQRMIVDMTKLSRDDRPSMKQCCERLLQIKEYTIKLCFVDKASNISLGATQVISVKSLRTQYKPAKEYSFDMGNGKMRKYRPCSNDIVSIPCWYASKEYTMYLELVRFDPDCVRTDKWFSCKHNAVGIDIGSSCTSVSYVDSMAHRLSTVHYNNLPRIPSRIFPEKNCEPIRNIKEYFRNNGVKAVDYMPFYIRFLEPEYIKACGVGFNVGQLVVAAPDDYSFDDQKKYLSAFANAHFSPKMITESEAVAFYFSDGIKVNDNILVADMGLDSLKVTIFRVANNSGVIKYKKLFYHKQEECGGANYTAEVKCELKRYIIKNLGISISNLDEQQSVYNEHVIANVAEKLKFSFGTKNSESVNVKERLYRSRKATEPSEAEFIMSRSEIKKSFKKLSDKVREALGAALTGARLSPDEIDHLYIAGGGFLLPDAMEPVYKMFAEKHCHINYANHSEAVSRGAAHYAALLLHHMQFSSTAPISKDLGVLVNMYVGGKAVFVPLITSKKMNGSIRLKTDAVTHGKTIRISVFTRPDSRPDVIGTLSPEGNCIKGAFEIETQLPHDVDVNDTQIELTLTKNQEGKVIAKAELIYKIIVKKLCRTKIEEVRMSLYENVFTLKR